MDTNRLGTIGTAKSVPTVQLRAVSGCRVALVPYKLSTLVWPVDEVGSTKVAMALPLPDTARSVKLGGLNDFVQLLRTPQPGLIDQSNPSFGIDALPTSLKFSCLPPTDSS